jgi:spore maturation protein SpmA
MLNKIWFGFFLTAFIAAVYQTFFLHSPDVFPAVVESTFSMAKLAVEISIGLVGVLCFWLGLFQVAEKAGLVQVIAKLLAPLFHRLMPGVPEGHPALGSVTMNLAANILGLDNAATPMGLKAMRDLQTLNPSQHQASDAQILFVVLNSSSITLLPISIFMYRAQMGAADPTSVFVPILLATIASTVAALMAVSCFQRIIWDRVVLAYVLGFAVLMGAFIGLLLQLPAALLAQQSSLWANIIIFSVIVSFLSVAFYKKINVYEVFIAGAKQGFAVGVKIIPYLVAMLVAIGVFRASGMLDMIISAIAHFCHVMGMDTRFVDALPTAFMKPLSGSGARAMMLETMKTHGVDSFASTLSAIIQGSTETTFYVLAVYFGAVGIRSTRHALTCGLIADVAGIAAAIGVAYWFFG